MKQPKTIPPTHLYLCIILNAALYFFLPQWNFIVRPYNYFGFIVIITGLFLVLYTHFLFKKKNTPENFLSSTCVVQSWPYSFSRNPMYLGMVILVVGIAICFRNIFGFISPVYFFLVIHFIFIPFEEKKMEKELGKEYLGYKKKVRRWI